MSTNTSQNLGLHLWEPTDQVLRTEFNQNWTKIDTAVNTAQETAEAAQDTADAAESKADALADAYTPDNKPYVIGTYKGNSAVTKITLGFQPSALIIARNYSSSDAEDSYGTCTIISGSGTSGIVLINEDGFTLFPNNPNIYPSVNRNNYYYYYIALR